MELCQILFGLYGNCVWNFTCHSRDFCHDSGTQGEGPGSGVSKGSVFGTGDYCKNIGTLASVCRIVAVRDVGSGSLSMDSDTGCILLGFLPVLYDLLAAARSDDQYGASGAFRINHGE